jgi:hypothetical protein
MIWSFLTVPFEVYAFVALEDEVSFSTGLFLEGSIGDGDEARLDGYSGVVISGDICCNDK